MQGVKDTIIHLMVSSVGKTYIDLVLPHISVNDEFIRTLLSTLNNYNLNVESEHLLFLLEYLHKKFKSTNRDKRLT